MIWADSSFLVSVVGNDANTLAAHASIRTLAEPMAFSNLHRLEIQNALSLMVFRGHYTRDQARAAWLKLVRHVRNGALKSVNANWGQALRAAARLAAIESEKLGTRSLDILHVAAARQLRLSEFWSFDVRQRNLAATVGLRVRP
jgi:predicted nucleic acid-binding protein